VLWHLADCGNLIRLDMPAAQVDGPLRSALCAENQQKKLKTKTIETKSRAKEEACYYLLALDNLTLFIILMPQNGCFRVLAVGCVQK